MCLVEPPVLRGTGSYEVSRPENRWDQPAERWMFLWLWHSGIFTCNAVPYAFSPGTIFVIPPRSRCVLETGPDGRPFQVYSHFVPSQAPGYEVGIPFQSTLKPDVQATFGRLFLESMDVFTHTEAYSKSLIWSMLWSISCDATTIRMDIRLETAERLMRERIAEPIRIAQIAEELEISHNQLTRIFRKEHGMTPQDYLRNLRLGIAVRLLAGSPTPIKTIAAAVGMPDLKVFNRFIKDNLGLPPSQVREQRSTLDLNRALIVE